MSSRKLPRLSNVSWTETPSHTQLEETSPIHWGLEFHEFIEGHKKGDRSSLRAFCAKFLEEEHRPFDAYTLSEDYFPAASEANQSAIVIAFETFRFLYLVCFVLECKMSDKLKLGKKVKVLRHAARSSDSESSEEEEEEEEPDEQQTTYFLYKSVHIDILSEAFGIYVQSGSIANEREVWMEFFERLNCQHKRLHDALRANEKFFALHCAFCSTYPSKYNYFRMVAPEFEKTLQPLGRYGDRFKDRGKYFVCINDYFVRVIAGSRFNVQLRLAHLADFYVFYLMCKEHKALKMHVEKPGSLEPKEVAISNYLLQQLESEGVRAPYYEPPPVDRMLGMRRYRFNEMPATQNQTQILGEEYGLQGRYNPRVIDRAQIHYERRRRPASRAKGGAARNLLQAFVESTMQRAPDEEN